MSTPGSQPSPDPLQTDHLQADLRGRSVRGGVLTLTSQITSFALQTVFTVVLARLLTPADFGMVAMVTAVTGLARVFADAGLTHATIQRTDINHHQVSALFWINAAIGLGLMLLTMALAPALAWFYKEPRLTAIAMVVAFIFLIGGLGVQHDALLKRQMHFKALAVRNIASYVVATALAVTMGWQGAGYWALVAFPVAMCVMQTTLSWVMVGWRPGVPPRDTQFRSLLVFGGNIAASNIIAYVNRNVDNVLIGWFWGAGPLGLYSKAYSLLMLPLHQLNAPVAAVAVPAFSRLQDDPERYARYYLRTINLIMWISAPLIGFLFIAAEPVILIVLGGQWGEAAVVFQLLAISALVQPLYNTMGWLFVSRGRPDRLLKLAMWMFPAVVGSFLIGLPYGIRGVALCYAVVVLLLAPWVFRFAFRGTELTLARFGRALRYPISMCLAAVAAAALAVDRMAPQSNLAELLVVGVAFAIVYGLALLLPPVREEFKTLAKLWHDLRPPRSHG